jgi:hypothetical protein
MGIQGILVVQLVTLKCINLLDLVGFDLLEYQAVKNYNMRYLMYLVEDYKLEEDYKLL